MKHCPQCQKRFSDDASVCPHDGTKLARAGLVGRTFFGQYDIVKKLGEGGMGAVYLARQEAIDQSVALKVLHARAAESDEIVQRFQREAKVISMLTHPNIVRVFIFGRTEDDLLYLVMEYVEGRELRQRLDQVGAIDEALAIKIMKQTCSALAEAHDLGIIHRDLKPDNILLTEFRGEKNFVKILDFGIAKIEQSEAEEQKKLTKAGIVYGTPEYVSPEQAQAIELDHRTDIYSLGCILFEMLTGRVPYQSQNPVQTLTKHVYEDPPQPSEFGDIAPTMERIILKAMAKDPDDRFDNALDMYEALVAREQELVERQKMSARDTYFPGSELTGLHQISSVEELTDEDDAVRGAKLQADGGTQGGFDTAKTMVMNDEQTQAMFDEEGDEAAAPSASPPVDPPQKKGDAQRKIIMIAIAALVFLVLVLLVVIGLFLFMN